MSLDELNVEEINFDVGLMNDQPNDEDNEFDLLIDPGKSRPASPENNVEMTVSNDIPFKSIDTKNIDKVL